MTDVATVVVDTRLDELVTIINQEDSLAFRAMLDALTHAILCGEALIEARAEVPDGQWLRWVDDNLEIPPSRLHRYMRLATYKDLIQAHGGLTSINAAITYLKETDVPAAGTHRNGRRPTFDVDEARRLREGGMTFTQIGEVVGVSDVAVWRQLTPGATQQAERYTSRAKKLRRAERAALAQQQKDKAVAKTGGAPAEAYALLRRCGLALDQATRESEDSDQIDELRLAASYVTKAEAAIVSALRLGRMEEANV